MEKKSTPFFLALGWLVKFFSSGCPEVYQCALGYFSWQLLGIGTPNLVLTQYLCLFNTPYAPIVTSLLLHKAICFARI